MLQGSPWIPDPGAAAFNHRFEPGNHPRQSDAPSANSAIPENKTATKTVSVQVVKFSDVTVTSER
jgi:hypothetical protein